MKVKGTRRVALAGGKLHVFSDAKRIIVQVRADGPQNDPLVTWAKAPIKLDAATALAVAGELLRAAAVLQGAESGNNRPTQEKGQKQKAAPAKQNTVTAK